MNTNSETPTNSISEDFLKKHSQGILTIVEVVRSLAWLHPMGGPIVGAILGVFEEEVRRTNQQKVNYKELIVKPIIDYLEKEKIDNIVATIDSCESYLEEVKFSVEKLAHNEITNTAFMAAVTRSGGYYSQILKELGPGNISIPWVIHFLCNDTDLNEEIHVKYENKTDWERAIKKLGALMSAMELLLRLYGSLIVIDKIVQEQEQKEGGLMVDILAMCRVVKPLGNKLNNIAKNMIFTRRAAVVTEPVSIRVNLYSKKISENIDDFYDKGNRPEDSIGKAISMMSSFPLGVDYQVFLLADENNPILRKESGWEPLHNDMFSKSALMVEDPIANVKLFAVDDSKFKLIGQQTEMKTLERKDAINNIRDKYLKTELETKQNLLFKEVALAVKGLSELASAKLEEVLKDKR
jgi:hypothetical protein